MSSKASKVKGLLSKGFKPDKCKTSIRLSVARMKLMRNKRDVQVKQVRREVAQLLQSGEESTARIRVDHVIRDEKTVSAYELLEVYCELIIQRLHIIDSQKICPIDLKEAIASVVFAAPRCADVPELQDVTKHFQAKYGKEFINSALELRPGSGVSQLVIDKLSASSANIETKVKVLKSIAEENNVKWDAKGFEEVKKTPELGRLEGSSKFLSVNEIATVQPATTQATTPVTIQTPTPATTYEPQYYTPIPNQTPPPATTYQPQNYTPRPIQAQPPAPTYQPQNYTPSPIQIPPPATTYQPQNYAHQNNMAYQPIRPNNSSSRISDPPLASPVQVLRSQSGSRYPESKYESEEETEKRPPDLPEHYEEYTTVEEAAEAAAKSAELASKAAKAAAAMARHGGLSREQSNVSSKSYSSRDSPRKHDMEEVSSKPEMHSTSSMQTHKSHAKGPQPGPLRPTSDRPPVAPPSPSSSHSSTSSCGYSELHEVTPLQASRKSPEYAKEDSFSKQKTVMQNDEEHYSGLNFGYNHSNSRGSTASQGVAIWDDKIDEEDSEIISSNIRFDSTGPNFDDSRFGTYDRPMYEEEPSFQFERKNSSASKGGTAWFSSDNFSSPKLPKLGSAHKDSSSLLFTSNTSEWDPPRSPADMESVTKFDNDPRSTSSSSLIKNDNSSPLDILSGWGTHQSHSDEDAGPKFDSGPNFDSDVRFDDENDKVNLVDAHEEEKVVGGDFSVSSLSPFSTAKERSKDTSISSSDESRTSKLPQSMRTRDSRTKPGVNITKEPKAKAEKAPLRYIPKDVPKENNSDDADEPVDQQFLNYDYLIGGRRNRPGNTRPPYTVKPLAEDPKPSNRPAIMKSTADLSVEEERLYTPSRSNNREYEVRRNSPFGDTTHRDEPSERKEAPRRTTLHYTPNRRNLDEEEEEEEIVQPAKIKVKIPSASRVSDYLDLNGEESEEDLAKPAKIKLKEMSSSKVSKSYLGLSENESVRQEPVKVSRRVVGSTGRDSLLKRTNKEEALEVRKAESMERTKKEVPSKSGESRTPRRPLYNTPTQVVDSDEEDESMERTKNEVPGKSGESRTLRRPLGYAPTLVDSDEEDDVRTVPPPKESAKPPTLEGSKEKVNMKENKEEVNMASAPPTFPRASFPLDMEALKARVQQIQATMNNR